MAVKPTAMPDEQMMDVEDIAEYLKVSQRWVRREAPGHGMALYGVGRFLRGYKSEIDGWVKQQQRHYKEN